MSSKTTVPRGTERRGAGGALRNVTVVERAVLEGLAGRMGCGERTSPGLAVVAPFTGEVIGEVPACTPADVRERVRRARAAQREWAEWPVGDRARVVLRFHDLLLDRQREILDLIQLETGKSRKHAFEEVVDCAMTARYYAFNAGRLLRPQRRRGAFPLVTQAWVDRQPYGVVGVISPGNFPLILTISDAIPALLAGNAVVIQPDPRTPFSPLWAQALLEEAGLPADLLGVVTGVGGEIGPALIDDVDYVFFTGSTRTGRVVAERAARGLVGCTLELGGKNAMIVLDDADLDAAVEGAVRGAFVGAGQVCISVERLYVQAGIYDRFVERLAARVGELRLGAGFDWEYDIGSLLSERELRTVEAHVRDAVDRGARVVVGGRARPDLGPFFFEPTVLAGVREGMLPFAEETFGPVLAVYPVATAEEAIRLANESRFALNASLWTRDVRRARRLAARLRAGSVNINEAYAASWGSLDAPMGGMKESGLGRRHGPEGFLQYTVPRTIARQRWIPLASFGGLSEEGFAKLITLVLRLQRRVPALR